ncbi:hypothetical protein LPJ54_004729 [Coemansia sp. RSA 1824]|nr:hypothetical protein LPJ54_004729 [Coemansia sp. RSA 1824]
MVDASATVLEAPREQSPVQTLLSEEKHRWRGRDVVFVDPLDTSAAYWWPAMIVPTDEIDTTMGCTQLGADEYLVKYFEDFKYSTVRGSELRAFDTSQRPYTDFAANNPSFPKDKAIRGALSFLKTGHAHAKFQWRQWQTGSDVLSLPFTLKAQPMPVDADSTSILVDSDVTLVKDDATGDDGDDEAGSPESLPSDKSRGSPELSKSRGSPAKTPPPQAEGANQKEAVESRGRRGRPGKRGRPVSVRQKRPGKRKILEQAADETPVPDTGVPRIQAVIKELEEVQEEYRFFRSLVRRSAKDLWLEMGNEWPPNLGTSTRFGKRRKVN